MIHSSRLGLSRATRAASKTRRWQNRHVSVRDVLSAQQTHNSNISPTGTDTTPADYTTHRHTAMMTKTTLLLLALATGTVVEATLQMVKGGGMCAGTDDSSNDYKVYYGTHAAPAAAWVRPP
jgi:hypothetical protein